MTKAHPQRLGEMVADLLASRIGSWGFVVGQSLLILVWIAMNAGSPLQPDPYPFILLNLLLSLQAAYTGPVLLISANRSAQMDRAMLKHIELLVQRMEREHKSLHQKIDQVLGLLGHTH
jgi:uncharacterized membrane protein